MMRVPGFGPEARAWQARVLPGYTTPAQARYHTSFKNFLESVLCQPL